MSAIGPDDVARYGAELHELAHGPHGAACDAPDYCRPQVRSQFDRYAEVLLRLLEGDGRLLPAHAETRTEWGVRFTRPDSGTWILPRDDEQHARMFLDGEGRELICRRIGPWLPAPINNEETRPASPFDDPGEPCGECGCSKQWHDGPSGRCAGDFLACRCPQYVPANTEESA